MKIEMEFKGLEELVKAFEAAAVIPSLHDRDSPVADFLKCLGCVFDNVRITHALTSLDCVI